MVACVQFALSAPGVAAVSLNTSRPERVAENVNAVEAAVPPAFWSDAKQAGLIAPDCSYVANESHPPGPFVKKRNMLKQEF